MSNTFDALEAKRICLICESITRQLEVLLIYFNEIEDDEQRKKFIDAVGIILGEKYCEIEEPIYTDFPELRPQFLKDK